MNIAITGDNTIPKAESINKPIATNMVNIKFITYE